MDLLRGRFAYIQLVGCARLAMGASDLSGEVADASDMPACMLDCSLRCRDATRAMHLQLVDWQSKDGLTVEMVASIVRAMPPGRRPKRR